MRLRRRLVRRGVVLRHAVGVHRADDGRRGRAAVHAARRGGVCRRGVRRRFLPRAPLAARLVQARLELAAPPLRLLLLAPLHVPRRVGVLLPQQLLKVAIGDRAQRRLVVRARRRCRAAAAARRQHGTPPVAQRLHRVEAPQYDRAASLALFGLHERCDDVHRAAPAEARARVHQRHGHLEVAVARRVVDGRVAARRALACVRAVLEQQRHDRHAVVVGRDVQRRAAVGVHRRRVGARAEERAHGRFVVERCRAVERTLLTRRRLVGVRAGLQKDAHDLAVVLLNRKEERRRALVGGRHIGVGAGGEQRAHARHARHLDGENDGRVAGGVLLVESGVRGEQGHERGGAAVRRHVQRAVGSGVDDGRGGLATRRGEQSGVNGGRRALPNSCEAVERSAAVPKLGGGAGARCEQQPHERHAAGGGGGMQRRGAGAVALSQRLGRHAAAGQPKAYQPSRRGNVARLAEELQAAFALARCSLRRRRVWRRLVVCSRLGILRRRRRQPRRAGLLVQHHERQRLAAAVSRRQQHRREAAAVALMQLSSRLSGIDGQQGLEHLRRRRLHTHHALSVGPPISECLTRLPCYTQHRRTCAA